MSSRSIDSNRPLTREEVGMLATLVKDGYAVALFTPDELNGVNATDVEEAMIQAGWNYIFHHEESSDDGSNP